MKKSKVRFVLIMLVIVLGLGFYIYDGFQNAPSRLKLNYKYIESEKIHSDLDGMQIAFISDMHYLTFFDDKRLDNLISKLNYVNPDTLIFLGDLVDKELDEEQYNKLYTALKSINPKYGKFAILGEADYISEAVNEQVEKLLYEADFEIIKNSSVKITKNSQQAIQLIGIDSPLNDKHDIETAYSNSDDSLFTITALHTPDTAKELPSNQTDLAIAGHSHGGQIKIPLLGQVYNQELAEIYYSGSYTLGTMKLYVTTGIGTTQNDVRINAPAEILIYTLKAK